MPAGGGLDEHLGARSTSRARDRIHVPARPSIIGTATVVVWDAATGVVLLAAPAATTLRASLRGVGVALLSVELLFLGSKGKRLPAILTGKGLLLEIH